jgi:hypothetical protein
MTASQEAEKLGCRKARRLGYPEIRVSRNFLASELYKQFAESLPASKPDCPPINKDL